MGSMDAISYLMEYLFDVVLWGGLVGMVICIAKAMELTLRR